MFRKSPSSTTTLWEVSQQNSLDVSFNKEPRWFDEYNYTVGLEDDLSLSPRIPLIVSIPGCLEQGHGQYSTGKLNVYFTLNQPFSTRELVLTYGFYGTEAYQLTLDGEPLLESQSHCQGQLKRAEVALNAISAGDHILSITVQHHRNRAEASQQIHSISYLQLDAKEGTVIDLAPVIPDESQSWLTRFKTLAMAMY